MFVKICFLVKNYVFFQIYTFLSKKIFFFVNLICFIENQTNGLKSKLKVKRFQIPSTDSD